VEGEDKGGPTPHSWGGGEVKEELVKRGVDQ